MRFNLKRKTVEEQRDHVAEQHPIVQLVPDKATERYPKAGQTSCGASRWLHGQRVVCELAPLHGGDHSHAGTIWRPRSGDDE